MLLACSLRLRVTQAPLRSRQPLAALTSLRPRRDLLPSLEPGVTPRSCYSALTTMADSRTPNTGGTRAPRKSARAEDAAVRPAPKRRSQKPVLVGEWQPTLPSRMGARSKGCGHYAWGNPNMTGRVAAFGEFVMPPSAPSCSGAMLSGESAQAHARALQRLTHNADLDGTVIQPKDGKAFPKDSFDWQFCSPLVVPKLRELQRAGSVGEPSVSSTSACELQADPLP
jgi:hypothetical protein